MGIFRLINSIHSDYLLYTSSELMNFFHSENWPSSSNERQALLQEACNRIADKRGTSRVSVSIYNEDNNNYGGYNTNKRITLNEKYLDNPCEALDTISHETNHHIQNMAIINGTSDYDHKQVLILKGENGCGYGKDGDYYELQDLELDSNNYAYKYVTDNHEQLKDDLKYHDYSKERQSFFERNCSNYNSEKDYWQQEEANQINKAIKNGELAIDDGEEAINLVMSDAGPFKIQMMENRELCNSYLNNYKEENDFIENENIDSQENNFVKDNAIDEEDIDIQENNSNIVSEDNNILLHNKDIDD